jgi:hypothetical protein
MDKKTVVMHFYQLCFGHGMTQNSQPKTLLQLEGRPWIIWLLVVRIAIQKAKFVTLNQIISTICHREISDFSANLSLNMFKILNDHVKVK